MKTFETEDILEKLDISSQGGSFPPIQMEEYYNAGFRLKVFLSNDEWILLFESIDFTETDYTFVNHLQACGNKYEDEGYNGLVEIITETKEQPFFDENDASNFILNPKDFEAMVRGKRKHFQLTDEDYEHAQADISDESVPLPAKLLRVISHKMSNELYFTDGENLKRLGKKPESFELFLDIKSWQHPDVMEMETPSETACFQSIADAIAKRDATIYSCPEKLHNSHWSNWEWYKEEDDEDYL